MRNKEIAYQIGTTEQVIKNYLRKVYDKLGVSDRLELALYCLHHQLLKLHTCRSLSRCPCRLLTQVGRRCARRCNRSSPHSP